MHLRSAHVASIVVGVAVVAGASLTLVQDRQTISADRPVGNARLTVSSQQVKVGDTFDMPVNLSLAENSGGASGVDIVINYNPTVLEVVDMDPEIIGTQVAAGDVFDFTQDNKVNSTAGVISLSVGQQPANPPVYSVNGAVASIRFKAIAPGQSAVRFVFQPGLLSDTNVIKAGDGLDLLASVQDATVTVSQ